MVALERNAAALSATVAAIQLDRETEGEDRRLRRERRMALQMELAKKEAEDGDADNALPPSSPGGASQLMPQVCGVGQNVVLKNFRQARRAYAIPSFVLTVSEKPYLVFDVAFVADDDDGPVGKAVNFLNSCFAAAPLHCCLRHHDEVWRDVRSFL